MLVCASIFPAQEIVSKPSCEAQARLKGDWCKNVLDLSKHATGMELYLRVYTSVVFEFVFVFVFADLTFSPLPGVEAPMAPSTGDESHSYLSCTGASNTLSYAGGIKHDATERSHTGMKCHREVTCDKKHKTEK